MPKPAQGDVTKFVAGKIKELRGRMPLHDFAVSNGIQQKLLTEWEDGIRLPCLSKLESLAKRNGVDVGFFFPGGHIPRNYPQFSGEVAA